MTQVVVRPSNAGSAYHRPSGGLAGFWVIALLGVDLAMSGGLSDISVSEVERRDVIISATTQAAIAAFGLLFLTCRAFLRGKNLLVIRRRDMVTFLLFLTWTVVVTLAALQGIASAYETGYILGDTYRFLRRYLEHRPPVPLTLRQIDPLIRQLTLYRDLVDQKTGGSE